MAHPTIKLGDVASLITKGTTPTTIGYQFSEAGIPFLRAEDIAGGLVKVNAVEKRINPECHKALARSQLRPNDLLITIAGTIGRVGIFPDLGIEANCNQAVCLVRLIPEHYDLEFLIYAVRSEFVQRQFKSQGTTATITNVSLAQIRGLDIPYLPISEQRRLVDILTRAESIVRLRREALKKTQEIIPALFVDMFGDPATNPKGWEISSLESVAQIISGITKGRKLDGADCAEFPYMRVANVKDGYLDLSEIKTILAKHNEIERFRLLPGDLLMTEGGDPDKLGRAAIWNGEIDLCLHQNHIFKVRANRALVLPEYLRELAGSGYGKAYFLQVAKKTTGIATINRTQLGRFPVLLPPMELQSEFCSRFDAIRSIQSQATRALATAEATFQSLLHRAFAGEL